MIPHRQNEKADWRGNTRRMTIFDNSNFVVLIAAYLIFVVIFFVVFAQGAAMSTRA